MEATECSRLGVIFTPYQLGAHNLQHELLLVNKANMTIVHSLTHTASTPFHNTHTDTQTHKRISSVRVWLRNIQRHNVVMKKCYVFFALSLSFILIHVQCQNGTQLCHVGGAMCLWIYCLAGFAHNSDCLNAYAFGAYDRPTKTVRRILCEHHLYGWSYDRCTASHQQSCEYKHYTFSYVSLLPIERSKLRSIFGVVLCCVSSMFLVWISGFILRYSYLYLYILGIALFIILVISVQVIEEKWKTRNETLNKTRLWMCGHLHYKYEKFTQIVLFLQSIFRSYCFMSLNTHTHI